MTTRDRSARVKAAVGHRRVRLSASDLREQMLSTALETIEEAGGLTVSLEHLNLEEIIRLAGVPRSSVFREWDTKEAFYTSLMVKMVEPTSDQGAAFDQGTLDIAEGVLREHQAMLSSADGRRQVLCEAARLAVRRNFFAVRDSMNWRTIKALIATLPALEDDHRAKILEAVTVAERHFLDRMTAFYESLFPQLGLRMKTGYSTRVFAATGAAVVEGLISRSVTNPDVVDQPLIFDGLNDERAEWHLSAIGFLAIVDLMVEPDPDFGAASPLGPERGDAGGVDVL